MNFGLVKEGIREPVRLLICGDRKWDNYGSIANKLRALRKKCGITLTVITGGCEGADMLADDAAQRMGIDRVMFPANWEGRGKAAGPIRNQKMLDWCKPNLVWAFHHDLTKSKGTKDMVVRSRKAKIITKVFDK